MQNPAAPEVQGRLYFVVPWVRTAMMTGFFYNFLKTPDGTYEVKIHLATTGYGQLRRDFFVGMRLSIKYCCGDHFLSGFFIIFTAQKGHTFFILISPRPFYDAFLRFFLFV